MHRTQQTIILEKKKKKPGSSRKGTYLYLYIRVWVFSLVLCTYIHTPVTVPSHLCLRHLDLKSKLPRL